jgi:hypothetical protein
MAQGSYWSLSLLIPMQLGEKANFSSSIVRSAATIKPWTIPGGHQQ